MAYQVIGFKTGTLEAGADLSAVQYQFVKLNAAGRVVAASVAGEKVIGVLQNRPTIGQPCEIVHLGLAPVKAGAAIAACGTIMTNATGRAVVSATTGSTIVGYACETAAAADEIITAFVNCGVGVV